MIKNRLSGRTTISIEHNIDISEFLSELELETVLKWYKKDLGDKEFHEKLNTWLGDEK